ncbi:PEP-CTERM sorting domain-containing protein [Phenylobacterium sp.]|jgi:hypothetical protein|uniref:PEP-CTERM sorting domain-containing protein n=1 Tax=Phenylobacterium sp. TaxID=1871053 RepID=UPI002F4186D1
MSDETTASADSAADAALERRRRRRLAAYTMLWTLILALLPSMLQIEPPRGARLDALRVLGQADGASGGPRRGRHRGRASAAATTRPAPVNYGALREAGPTELALQSGLAGNVPQAVQDIGPLSVSDPMPVSTSLLGANPATAAAFSFPNLPFTSLPSLVTGPFISNPGAPPTPVTPPVTTNPIDPGTPGVSPNPPVIVTPPTTTPTPPDDGNPIVSPPTVIPPDGPPVVVVTTPTDPGDPGTPPITGDPGLSPPGGSTPIVAPAGVPEPSTWVELIGGCGLAGALLRRRRQPPTTFLARSSALTVVSRLG